MPRSGTGRRDRSCAWPCRRSTNQAGRCEWISFESIGPAGATALHGVGDIGVPALANEIREPSFTAVRLRLISDAGQSAAVPQQQRQLALAVLWQKVLHVHLLDLVLAVGVHLRGNAARCEHNLLDGLPADRDDAPADVERAHIAQPERLFDLCPGGTC